MYQTTLRIISAAFCCVQVFWIVIPYSLGNLTESLYLYEASRCGNTYERGCTYREIGSKHGWFLCQGDHRERNRCVQLERPTGNT